MGKGLVNSFLNGDGSTGTLTSPPFEIQRKYINFLIAGGGHPGKTCINLLLDGNIVRTASGTNISDGSEMLDWKSWDVKELQGKKVQIQIVDSHRGSWGHISIDHIFQSNEKVEEAEKDRTMRLTKRYLNLPVKHGAARRRMDVLIDGKIVRQFEI